MKKTWVEDLISYPFFLYYIQRQSSLAQFNSKNLYNYI